MKHRHPRTIAQLERHHDDFQAPTRSAATWVAISEELGAQFEKFLRAQTNPDNADTTDNAAKVNRNES